MRRTFSLCIAIVLLLVSCGYGNSRDQETRWRIDLRALGYGDGDLIRVAFCGPVLMLYTERNSERLLFDAATHQRVSGQLSPEHFALCGDSLQPQPVPSAGQNRIVASWKQMVVKQVCDVESCSEPPGKPLVRDVKFYLKKPHEEPVLLFHEHALVQYPQFLSDEYVLFFRYNLKSVVINSEGKQVYQLPVFDFPYVTVSSGGTRFAVFERSASFFHELTGTTNRARVSVFQTSNGKKLFKLAWHLNGESIANGRVALSDDGFQVAVVRLGEVLVFKLPVS